MCFVCAKSPCASTNRNSFCYFLVWKHKWPNGAENKKKISYNFSLLLFCSRRAHTSTIDLSCGVHRVNARRGDGYSAMHGPRSYTTIEIELSVFFSCSRVFFFISFRCRCLHIWCRRPSVFYGNLNLFLIEFRCRFERGRACHHRMLHYFGQVCQVFLLLFFCSGQFECTSQSTTIRPNFSCFIQMHSAIHF